MDAERTERRDLLDSDDDDEEDTVFDFQSQNDKQIGAQILMLFTWTSMGLLYAIPGPNLLAITCNLKTTLERVGILFVSRSVGSLFGKIISNYFIQRSRGYGIIALPLLVIPVLMSVFPLIKGLDGAAVIMLSIGGAYGMITEGYNIMDSSNRLNKAGKIKKASLALSLGAGIAPVISSPFIKAMGTVNQSNRTRYNVNIFANLSRNRNIIFESKVAYSVYPGISCANEGEFAKSFWISTIPCYLLIFHICFIICRKSHQSVIFPACSTGADRSNDCKIYVLRLMLFLVTLFYSGIYRIMELVIFTYISLGPFNISTTKACLLTMMLWVAFAFGHILQYVVLLKIEGTERRQGVAFFKSCVCFVMSILLLKIDNTNGLTLSLFFYMFFVSELGPLVQDGFIDKGIVSELMLKKMTRYADALAEVLFPVASLALMYSKGWHSLSFTVLVLSVLQFLLCALLALYPLSLPRNISSLQYENLEINTEDGNGTKIQKEINKLLGGYTDPEVSYATSDEEVVFDMKRRQRTR